MANLAADERDPAQGMQWAERALAADPRSAAAHYALGRVHEARGDLATAESSYRSSLALDPLHARAHNNLGGVLHMQGRLAEALACYRRALELDPALPEAAHNYASIARDARALDNAAEGYRALLARNPGDADAWTNLGNALRELDRHDEALQAFSRALELDPAHAEAHFSSAFVFLLRGDYARGWKEYEWRWRRPIEAALLERFGAPIWDGRTLQGGCILLHAEQGLGDTLQFARYAPLVAARCREVVLECQPELAGLMRGVAGIARVISRGDALPRFDAHAPLLSLPAIFGTNLETIPWNGPYIRTAPANLPPEGPRVGLAWAGRPEQWDDRKRSLTLERLAPLAKVPGVSWFSLQKGEAAAAAANPPPGMHLADLGPRIKDFSDTASFVSALDLVVTVDTSVAHLAGAMGARTWVLVAHAPDWRYHLAREDNPWYPGMRLFRQPRDGDWDGAIAALRDALRGFRA